jgi:deoxyribonuclease-4
LHPGPLYGKKTDDSIKILKDNLNDFFTKLGKTDTGLFLETAGKVGQLGSVKDVFDVSQCFETCYPCIDFGHVHARTIGSLETKNAIDSLFEYMNSLQAFSNNTKIHFHYTPIHYGAKGEIVHKAIEDKYPPTSPTLFEDIVMDKYYHPRYEPIIENFVRFGIENCTIISETHNSQEIGALAMSNFYKGLTTVKEND